MVFEVQHRRSCCASKKCKKPNNDGICCTVALHFSGGRLKGVCHDETKSVRADPGDVGHALLYAADSGHPVYAERPFERPAKALQRGGFLVIDPDNIIRLTDAGRDALARQRRPAVRGKKVVEGLTLYLPERSDRFYGRKRP
jgi:hypothetical protein